MLVCWRPNFTARITCFAILLAVNFQYVYALSVRQGCGNGTYTAAIGLNFDTYCGMHITGHDIESGTVDSWTDCMESCADEQPPGGYPTCQVAVYRESDKLCFLKDGNASISDASLADGYHTAIAPASQFVPGDIACPFPDLSTQNASNGMPFQIHCWKDAVWGDVDMSKDTYYTPQHVDSLPECMELCSKGTPLCYGVAYNPDLARGYHNCYIKTADVTTHIISSDYYVHLATLTDFSIDVDCQEGTYVTANNKGFNKRCKQSIDGDVIGQTHTASLESCVDYCATFVNGSQSCTAVRHQPNADDGWENCYLQAPAQFFSASRSDYNMALLATQLNTTNSSSSSSSSNTDAKSSSKAWIAGAVVGPLAAIGLLVGGFFWLQKKKRTKANTVSTSESDMTNYYEKGSFIAEDRHEIGDTYRDSELDVTTDRYEMPGSTSVRSR